MMQEKEAKGENKMPKGKGTYGKQVGRPSEDARSRRETYQLGGQVGQQGFGQRPLGSGVVSPMVSPPLQGVASPIPQLQYEEGGKIKHKTSTGQVNEYPDTKKGRSMMEEDKITDSIKAKREAKAKKEAASKAKVKKAKDIKKSQARDKKDKKAGVKKYGSHWAQGELKDMGSGRTN